MKCPVCGAAELIHDSRDLPYTYEGETTIIIAAVTRCATSALPVPSRSWMRRNRIASYAKCAPSRSR